MKKSTSHTGKRPKKFRILRAYSILFYGHRLIWPGSFLFPGKEQAQRVWPAVGEDGAARLGLDDLAEAAVLFHIFPGSIYCLIFKSGRPDGIGQLLNHFQGFRVFIHG